MGFSRSLSGVTAAALALLLAASAPALAELRAFRQKADCGSPNWFVCGSAAQMLV